MKAFFADSEKILALAALKNNKLASASKIIVSKSGTGKKETCLHTLIGIPAPSMLWAPLPNNKLACAGTDRQIIIWDVLSGQYVETLPVIEIELMH